MAKLGILLCTTTIFGLALAGLQPASAQNSPNMPNIRPPDISSTRPDFSRPGGLPGAARDIAPADRFGHAEAAMQDSAKKAAKKKASKKIKDKVKSAARGNAGAGAGANVNAPAIAGQDAAGLTPNQLAPVERLRAYLDGITDAEEVRHLRDLLDGLLRGDGSWGKILAGAAAGRVPGSGGRQAADPKGAAGEAFPRPVEFMDASKTESGLRGWDERMPQVPRYGNRGTPHVGGGYAPNDARGKTGFKDPSGQAAHGWTLLAPPETTHWTGSNGVNYSRTETWYYNNRGETHKEVIITGNDGSVRIVDRYSEPGIDSIVARTNPDVVLITSGSPSAGIEGGDAGAAAGSGNPPDSNPDPEGRPVNDRGGGAATVTARFGGRTVRCDFFGCVETSTSSKRDDPRIGRNPDGMSTGFVAGGSAGPGAATDPCPDCGPGGTGGGGGFKPPGPGGDPINPNVEGSGSGVGPPSPR